MLYIVKHLKAWIDLAKSQVLVESDWTYKRLTPTHVGVGFYSVLCSSTNFDMYLPLSSLYYYKVLSCLSNEKTFYTVLKLHALNCVGIFQWFFTYSCDFSMNLCDVYSKDNLTKICVILCDEVMGRRCHN